MANAKARSSYQRKQKKPFRYSDTYNNWLNAVKKHGASSPEAQHWSNEHKRKFLGIGAEPELARAA